MMPNQEEGSSLLLCNAIIGNVFFMKERVASELEICKLIIDSKQNLMRKAKLQ